MLEPDARLDPMAQEELRRIFWSTYLLDKFAMCKRTRPAAIADDDCRVHLPSHEAKVDLGRRYALEELHQISTTEATQLDSFTVLVWISSTLASCAKYNLHEQGSSSSTLAPWDASSTFSTISSNLMLFESVFGMDESLANISSKAPSSDGSVTIPQLILSRAVFHLCNMLLYNPLLLVRRPRPLKSRMPGSFLRRASQTSREHAVAMTNLLRESGHSEFCTFNPMLAYCAWMAGITHCLHLASGPSEVQTESTELVDFTLTFLDEVSSRWRIGGSMVRLSSPLSLHPIKLTDWHAVAPPQDPGEGEPRTPTS